MAYEYQESDIMFSELGDPGGEASGSSTYYIRPPQPQPQRRNSADAGKFRKNNNQKRVIHSMPICIPERDHLSDEFEAAEEGWERGGQVVPPHLIAARRLAGEMEFSVCSGKGRTLKGRALKEVRNEILRMTGFLEA